MPQPRSCPAPPLRQRLRAARALALAGLLGAASSAAAALPGLSGITPAQGLYPEPIQFEARGAGQIVLLDPRGLTLVPRAADQPAVRLVFLAANPDPALTPEAPLPGHVNVLRGRAPTGWRRHLPRYGALRYRDLYPGVDLVLQSRGDGSLKRDLLVAAGGDARAIAFRYEGAADVSVGEDGTLRVDTGQGVLTEAAPVAWQERDGARSPVSAAWRVGPDGHVTYALGDYDPSLPLTIDPGLDFTAYVGGDGYDEVNALTTNSAENFPQGQFVYLAGATTSVDLPLAGTSPQGALHTNTYGTGSPKIYRSRDAFVMKLDADGKLVWATFWGGKTDWFPHSICLDDPPSPTGCVTYGASPWGLGGLDTATAVAVARTGVVAVVGETNALDFPTLPAAGTIQNDLSDVDPVDPSDLSPVRASDAFVVAFDQTGQPLLSTYLGGTRRDVAHGVAFDSTNAIWVVGLTGSAEFPTTPDRVQGYVGGTHTGLSDEDYDAFAARIELPGATGVPALKYATLLGGDGFDEATAVTVTGRDQVVIAGSTDATSLGGGTLGAVQPSYGGGGLDGFVAVLQRDPKGTFSLAHQTYVGGVNADGLDAVVALETPQGDLRRVVVGGSTDSPALWSAACGAHAYEDCGSDGTCNTTAFMRYSDGFVAAFDLAHLASPGACGFRRYLGGEVRDEVQALAADPVSGELYVAGTTWSADFPVLAALQPVKADKRSAGCLAAAPWDCADNSDAFFARLSADGKDLLISSFLGGTGQGPDTDDTGRAIAFDTKDGVHAPRVYVAGQTYSADFPRVGAPIMAPKDTANVASGFVVRAPVDVADLRITEATLSPAAVAPGEAVTLTVKVRNDGPEPTDGLQLALKASADLTWVDPPTGCATEPNTVTCGAPKTLARSAAHTYTLRFEAPGTKQTLSLDVTATSTRRDPNDANNRVTLTLPVGGYDVAVQAARAPDPVGYGQAITYTLSATNRGPDVAHDVALTLTFDPTVSPFLAASSDSHCSVGTPDNQVVCWPSDPVAKGDTVGPYTVTLRAPEETRDVPVIAGYAAAGDPQDDRDHTNDRVSVVTRVRPADVQLVSAVSAPEPAPTDGTLTITATMKNLGPGPAESPIVYAEPLDADLVFQTEGSDARCTKVFGTPPYHAQCALAAPPDGSTPTLAEGATETFTLAFHTPSTSKAVKTRVTARTSDDTHNANDLLVVTSHVGHADVAVQGAVVSAPLSIPYGVNHLLSVTATLANLTDDVDAKDVVVGYGATTDAPGSTGQPFVVVAVSGETASGVAATCTEAPAVRCSFPTIPKGDTATMLVSTLPTRRGTQHHTIQILSAATPDPDKTNDEATLDTVIAGYDLALGATTSPTQPLQRGVAATWTQHVTNAGPGQPTGAALDIALDPAYFTWTGQTTTPGGQPCTVKSPRLVSCPLGAMDAGAGADVSWELIPVKGFRKATPEATTGDLTLTARATFPDDDRGANDRKTLSTLVDGADLSVTATGPTASVQVGDDVTFHVAVSNASTIDAKSPLLRVVFDPVRWAFVANADPLRPCTVEATGIVSCALSPLVAQFALPDFTLTLKALAPGTVDTVFRVTDGPDETEDTHRVNNEATVSTTIAGADLQLANPAQDVANPVSVTRAVRYTFDVLNPSTEVAAKGFTVVFRLDAAAAGKARVVLGSIGPDGAPCAIDATQRIASCVWSAGLPKASAANTPAKISVAIDTLGMDRGTYGATAAVVPLSGAGTSPDPDPNPANNALGAGSFHTVREGHHLAVTASYADEPFQKKRGEQVVYTVHVTNDHATTAKDVLLTFHWGNGQLDRDQAVAPPTGCQLHDAVHQAECSLGDLAKGASADVSFTFHAVRAGDAFPQAAVVAQGNPKHADAPKGASDWQGSIHLVGADLAVTGVSGPSGALRSGDAVDLEVTVKNLTKINHIPAVSRAATLSHTGWGAAPGENPYLQYAGSSVGQPTGGPPCVDHSGTLQCPLGTFLTNESETVYLHFLAMRPGTFTHTFSVAEAQGALDEDPTDNVASYTTTIKGPDLVLTAVSVDTPAGVGVSGVGLGYKLVNASPDTAATNVKVRFTLSQQTAGPAGGFIPTVGGQGPSCSILPANVVECTVGTLNPGASVPLVSAAWDAKKVGAYRVLVRAESDGTDAHFQDNLIVQNVEIQGPDLAVTGTPYTGPTARRTPFTLNVSVANVGLGVSEDTSIVLPLAPSITYKSAVFTPPGGASCAPAHLPDGQDGVVCKLGRLTKADGARQLAMTLVATKKGTYGFDFTAATAPHADADATNQRTKLWLDFDGADLWVQSVTGPGTASVNHGEQLSFDVVLHNDGPADAFNPQLKHTFDPKHLKFVSANGDGVCVADPVGLTLCSIDGLTAGTESSISIIYEAREPGVVTSGFEVGEPGQSDEDPLNNTASKVTTVRGADLGVTLADAPDPVAVGQPITYTATVQNYGPARADDTVASLRLPPEVQFVSASPGCKLGVRTVECAPMTLAAGATMTWTVTAKAKVVTPSASARASAAAVGSEEAGPQPDTATVGTTITDADADADGISGQTEDGAPDVGAGKGDGNGDGTPDKDQANVASFPNAKGDYVTIVTSQGSLKNVSTTPAPTPTPSGVAFPVDALSYEVTGLAAGATTTVTVLMPTGIPAWAYWKYGPEPGNTTPHWYDFSFDGTTGAKKVAANKLELTLVDGGRGDDDLSANGTIVDPGAPALPRLVVDSVGDEPDASPGDGVCDTGGGSCTLRAAVQESNARGTGTFIAFAVPGSTLPLTIQAPSGLPALSAPAVVDGSTQPGWTDAPVVTVSAPAWDLTAGDSALRWLDLPGGVALSGAGRDLVTDCAVGPLLGGVAVTGVDGSLVRRSAVPWVQVTGPAARNRIVDNDVAGSLRLTDATETLVRGNAIHDEGSADGVTITGGAATGNRVVGNLIGLDAHGACTHYASDPGTNTPGAGPCDGGAAGWGVRLTGGAWGNDVGGPGFGEGNVISANALGGVLVDGGAHDNRVAGNLFGTDPEGVAERHPVSATYQLENRGPCVQVSDASANVVGGPTAEHRNVCAGRGVAVLGAGSDGNAIQGNWVMLDARGDVPWVRLTLDDVLLVRDATNTVVSGNVVPTVEVTGTATGTQIADNYIGTDPSGTRAFYADQSVPGTTRIWSRGVLVHGSATSTTVSGNLISGSYLDGVDIWESATFVTVSNNRIGVDASGVKALPNWKSGVQVDARYGGTVSDVLLDGNVIAGNGAPDAWAQDADFPFPGIWLREGAARVTVQGNTVGLGTDKATPLGHLGHGIWANGAPQLTVTGNLVGANQGDGIRVDNGPLVPYPSDGAVVRGNIIGTDALGLLDLGNAGAGVRVHESGAVVLGGVGAGEGNTVAHSGGPGLWVEAGGQGNTVRGNSLYDNAGLGFDLNNTGVDENGVYDGSTNADPELPLLATATESAGTITVTGTHAPAAAGTYTLDFYLDQAPDPTGHGEGRTWLGATTLSGASAFSVDLARGGALGAFVSATATDAAGNTSELSRFAWIDAAPAWTDVGVTLGETAGSDPTCVGCQVTWFADVRVAGPGDAANVSLVFDYPAGVTYGGESAGMFTCTFASPKTTCTAATLPVGTYQVLFYGTTTTAGLLTSTATVSTTTTDPAPLNDSDAEETSVGPADLSVTATPPAAAAVGAPLTVAATVHNDYFHGGATTSPVVTVALPAGVTFSGAAAQAGTCAEAGGVVTCALDPLGADTSTGLTVTVVPQAVGTVTIPFSVTAAGPDAVPANNHADATVEVVATARDLSVTQVVTTAGPMAGVPYRYEITVTNAGPSPAVAVSLVDTLQLQAYPVDMAASQGSCWRDEDGAGVYTGKVRCDLGTLAAGASATVSLDALASLATSIQNDVCVTAPGEDVAPGDDCATTLTPVGAVDLSPALVASPSPGTQGQPLTLTATVHNAGPATAPSATVAVGLPQQLVFVSADKPCQEGTSAQTGQRVATCDLGDIAAGVDAVVVLTLDAQGSGTGLPVTAEVASGGFDTATYNDTAYSTVDIDAVPAPCPADRQVVLYADTDETDGSGWMTSVGDYCNAADCTAAAWTVASDAAHAGTKSWHVPGLDGGAQVTHRMVTAVSLAGLTEAEAVFWHRWDQQPGVDGGTVWITATTTPGESNFSEAAPVYTLNPPTTPTSAYWGDVSYTGRNPSWPAFDETRIDLSSYLGQYVRLVFKEVTDQAVGGPGWWVDGLEIRGCQQAPAPGLTCPAGYAATELVSDTTESGGAGWGPVATDTCSASDCTNASWSLVTDAAHGGASSWFCPDLDGSTSLSLATTAAVDLTDPTLKQPALRFFHRHAFEDGYDGGRVVLSTDDGQNWQPLPAAAFTKGGPNGWPAAFGGELAYTGQSLSWPAFEEVRVDLSAYLGQRVLLRLHVGTDGSGAALGWWVDELAVTACAPVTDADLALTAAGPAAGAANTEALTYTFTVTNAGPVDAEGVTVNVNLPAALHLASPDCDPSGYPDGTSCALGTLGVGQSRDVVLTGYADAPGAYDVAGVVSSQQPDPTNTNDSGSVHTVISGEVLVGAHLEVISGPPTLAPGEAGVVTWAVSNLGPRDAPLTLSILVPATLTATPPPGCTQAGALLTCDLGTVGAGAAATEVAVDVTAVSPGAATLTAALALGAGAPAGAIDPDASDNAAAHTVDVAPQDAEADLRVAVAPLAPSPTVVQQEAPFVVTVTNDGPALASTVTVALTTAGGDFTVASDATGAACDATGCALPALPAGEAWEIAVTGAALTPGTLTVEATAASPTADPDPTNDAAQAEVQAVAPAADLGVTWTNVPAAAQTGAPFQVTATATNAGPLPAPAAALEVALTGPGRLTGALSGCALWASGAGARCELGDLAAGATVDRALMAVADGPGALTLTATVASDEVDPGAANDSAQASVAAADGLADLGVTATLLSPAAGPATVGQSVQARLVVSLLSGDDAPGARLSVTLPPAAAAPTVTPSEGVCVTGAAAVFCDLGGVAAGATVTVDLTVPVTTPAETLFIATVGADVPDPDDTNNTALLGLSVVADCGGAAPCDDGDPCTEDLCDPATGCTHVPGNEGGACDDGDPCTVEDRCVSGGCWGTMALCDDGDPCTLDTCDGETGCAHEAVLQACDDGDACTTGDVCLGGVCGGTGALSCDDGDDCTNDLCDPTLGCVHQAGAGCCTSDDQCNDLNPCTVDTCDAATGDCAHAPEPDGAACDLDGDLCTGDVCAAGACEAGPALDCDDGDACTVDACDPASGCTHEPTSGCCQSDADCPDDGDACTWPTTCQEGICVPGEAVNCDDGDPCTVDACDPASGCASTLSTAPECACGLAKTRTECQGAAVVWLDGCGELTGTALACDDGDPTTDDRCDAEAAVCLHVPLGVEACDVTCSGDWAAVCAEGTLPGAGEADLGQNLVWLDPCGGAAGVAAPCGSTDPCAVSSCDAQRAACVTTPSEAPGCAAEGGCDATRTLACEDGALVWRDGCGATLGVALSCDDGDPATTDTCDAEGDRCLHVVESPTMPDRLCPSAADAVAEPVDQGPVDAGPADAPEVFVDGSWSYADTDGGGPPEDDELTAPRHTYRRDGGGCGQCGGAPRGPGLMGLLVGLWLLARRRRRRHGAG